MGRKSGVFSALLVMAAFAAAASPQARKAGTDSKTINHVLNRLGYGPTPATIERVRQMGISAYTDEQLHPERISDSAAAARLAGFTTLTKSTAELAQEYFLPAMQQRRQQQRRAAQAEPNDTDMQPGTQPKRTPEQMEMARAQRAVIA